MLIRCSCGNKPIGKTSLCSGDEIKFVCSVCCEKMWKNKKFDFSLNRVSELKKAGVLKNVKKK